MQNTSTISRIWTWCGNVLHEEQLFTRSKVKDAQEVKSESEIFLSPKNLSSVKPGLDTYVEYNAKAKMSNEEIPSPVNDT